MNKLKHSKSELKRANCKRLNVEKIVDEIIDNMNQERILSCHIV